MGLGGKNGMNANYEQIGKNESTVIILLCDEGRSKGVGRTPPKFNSVILRDLFPFKSHSFLSNKMT